NPAEFFLLNESFDSEYLSEEKEKLKNILNSWAEKHAAVIFQKNHSATKWRSLQNALLNYDFIYSVTNDQWFDPVKQKYAHIEPFFRGIHQMIEISMSVIIDYGYQLQQDIKQLKTDSEQLKLDPAEYQRVLALRGQMKRLQQWWEIAAIHLML